MTYHTADREARKFVDRSGDKPGVGWRRGRLARARSAKSTVDRDAPRENFPTFRRICMNTLATTVIGACIALAISGVAAQGTMKKDDPMSKDSMAKGMTMQEC